MKVLIYADFRSGFARDWVDSLRESNRVTVVTVGSRVDLPAADLAPAIGAAGDSTGPTRAFLKGIRQRLLALSAGSDAGSAIQRLSDLATRLFYLAQGPLKVRALRAAIAHHQPDVVHAMRLPYEGITAANLSPDIALVCSVWGNDFTLHARRSLLVAWLIRRALKRTNGLHADAHRDLHIAQTQFGMPQQTHRFYAPTSGGVRLANIRLDISKAEAKQLLGYDPNGLLICNPRGMRGYVRSESFCALHRQVSSAKALQYIFLGAGSLPEGQWGWSDNGANPGTGLIQCPGLSKSDLYLLLRATDIIVSPTTHDGLPNSVLESMASGAIPVLSNVDSVVGLIKQPQQGRVFELEVPGSLRDAVQDLLDEVDLPAAQSLNEQVIRDGYSSASHLAGVLEFYQAAMNNRTSS